MKAIFLASVPASIAVIGLVCYFFGMFVVFVISPIKNAKSFGVQPVDNSGKAEIRVYYGGMSLALAVLLVYLTIATKTAFFSLVCGMILSTTIFLCRVIFVTIDKAWKCPYTKLAIPAEGFFVVALWICYIIAKNV
ncbi:MAG: hypothetical protein RR123_01705 [Clostridia bacterium]